ncbi:hypothetical protein BEWA_021500 [Theileria equi strain WA]|uniref:IQ calmodulin-binding motif family protein n=1 Tax=Theileria equi strain WA TaxID=1537102 RepID=L0AUJ6_THEEQ|nr:hypothetical protein BEWA_021500 [Theileria equi strain WA]AFZ79302.1 hypothetical protein BEWA_021500 [Theileria equi strain WA]|eukprot:XP_004828968.1 hypothetical protein BEWA_021500 [Theileria equi strain WA]
MESNTGEPGTSLSSQYDFSSDFSDITLVNDISCDEFTRYQSQYEGITCDESCSDLLYVENLTREGIARHLLSRYRNSIYFTYFGNVLFYVKPADYDPLKYGHAKFLYDKPLEPHVFSLSSEILTSLANFKPGQTSNTDEHTTGNDVVHQVRDSFEKSQDIQNNNFNLFFYGEDNFTQLRTMQQVSLFLCRYAHVLGLEPTASMDKKLSNAQFLLGNLDDYFSLTDVAYNYMVTYKFDFNERGLLSSIRMIPNLSTDLSCSCVSHRFRDYLSANLKSGENIRVRYPTVFYGFIYTILDDDQAYASDYGLNSYDAAKLLEMIPKHEIQDTSWHLENYERFIKTLLTIGMSIDEVQNTAKTLVVIMLFDILLLAKTSATDINGDNPFDENLVKDLDGTILFCGRDLLGLIFDIFEINILTKSSLGMKSSDVLFKFELLSQENSWILDNLSTALFIRLKHMIYTKINNYLVIEKTLNVEKSISLHCNAGFSPHSNFIKFADDQLPQLFSEEIFIRKFVDAFSNNTDLFTNIRFIKRNKNFLSTVTNYDGLVAKVILSSVSQNSSHDGVIPDGKVSHSWSDISYDIPKILDLESRLYSISPMLIRLFKLSGLDFVKRLAYSSQSLYPVVGNCSAALSYYNFMNDCACNHDTSYFVICSSMSLMESYIGNEDIEDENFLNYNLGFLMQTFARSIPILDMCIIKRDSSVVSILLSNAAKSYKPLVYMMTSLHMHQTISLMDDSELLKLLFRILEISDSLYQISDGMVVMKKFIYVRFISFYMDYIEGIIGSVKTIQRLWRKHSSTLRKNLRESIVKIQSYARSMLFKKLRLSESSVCNLSLDLVGLVVTICSLRTSLTSISQKTLELLYLMEKEYHEKEYNYIKHAAAIYIQSHWRGAIQRKRYSLVKNEKLEEFAIILIQSTIRRLLATDSILNEKDLPREAAIKIQSVFRGYLVRSRFETLRYIKLLLPSIVRKGSKLNSLRNQINFIRLCKEQGAESLQMRKLIHVQTNLPSGFVKVQNLVRMWFVRKQYLHLRNCLEKVQALAMTKVARASYLEKVAAATKIQRWWRCIPKTYFSSISMNVLSYIKMREITSVGLLSSTLQGCNISIFDLSLFQDIRQIYPNTWAMAPLGFMKNMNITRKLALETHLTENYFIRNVMFSIGATHSLMLVAFSDGTSSVFSWGWNDKGQLGRKCLYPLENDSHAIDSLEFDISVPTVDCTIYENPVNKVYIASIACGNDFSVALSQQGTIFTWGDNYYGQCGHGSNFIHILHPTALLENGTNIFVASYHSIVSTSSGEYLVFGRTFNKIIYVPTNIKLLLPDLRNQTIKKIKVSGAVSLICTTELDYILNVYGNLHKFSQMYNLGGTIVDTCTNGRTIYAIVEYANKSEEIKLYVWGSVRCFSGKEKTISTDKSLIVSAFREKFENKVKKKTQRSLLQFTKNIGKSCFLQAPTEVLFDKCPKKVFCDNNQLVVTTEDGLVFGTRLFQLMGEDADSIETDEFSIRLKSETSRIKLVPSLYQFTNIKKKHADIHFASNSLSHSIGYTF